MNTFLVNELVPVKKKEGYNMRSFIISHNTRIQCLVEAIQSYFGIITTNKTRFQNCVILKIEIGTYASISMVYSGELNSRERSKVSVDRPYYIKEEDYNTLQTRGVIHKGRDVYGHDQYYRPTPREIVGYMMYPSRRTTDPETLIHIRNGLKLHTDEEHVFYLIRHGQAEHNLTTKIVPGVKVSRTLGVKLDTSITKEDTPEDLPESGKWQARRAGMYLREHEVKGTATRDIFFVSDLIRTHETGEEIKEQLGNGTMSIVLPCASELSQKGIQGNCDSITADTSILKKIARENYSACAVTNRGMEVVLTESCNHLVDWKAIYLPFYGHKVRGQEDSLWGSMTLKRYSVNLIKQHCRDTTMISMAACYYKLKSLLYNERVDALRRFIEENKVARPYKTTTRGSIWRVGGRKRTFRKK